MPRTIYIAMPCYSGQMSYATLLSLSRASTEAARMGWQTDFTVRTTDSILPRARNVLINQFLQRTTCSDILFIDSDVAWYDGGFARIMSHNVDVVGGAYRQRCEAESYVLRPLLEAAIIDPTNGLMEVEAAATGFLRISRAAVEKLVEVHADEWYEDQSAEGLKIYNLFDFQLQKENRQYWSEDYVFCQRWRALGGRVWVDPELKLDHAGLMTFTGTLGDWMRKRHAELQAAQQGQIAEVARTLGDGSDERIAAAKALIAGEPAAGEPAKDAA